MLYLSLSYWFFLLTTVLLHGRVSGQAGKKHTSPSHLLLAGLLDCPHCPRLSKGLPLNPGGIMSYYLLLLGGKLENASSGCFSFLIGGLKIPCLYVIPHTLRSQITLAFFLASFRVLLCLFFVPFSGFIKLCLVGRSKKMSMPSCPDWKILTY